ncbi:uncharacterized protein LOC143558212 [Bidens hawaiensis]|uniref:uncharacterized protein LOC143558212 n=1 Tax=Bidens hawaiensis TaxID=980011 RepID=UPI00404927BC
METLNDYGCEIIYHERKANVVAGALSRKEHEKPKRVRALRLELQIDLIEQIKRAQKKAIEENQISEEKRNGTIDSLVKGDDEILRLGTRIWVPKIEDLRERIMNEAHRSKYMMHPEFKCNLLSISKLTNSLNSSFTFYPSFCYMQDLHSRKLIGMGKERDGLYWLEPIHKVKMALVVSTKPGNVA